MPLFEFECPKCNKTVELLIRRPDDVAECPECGSTKLTQLISAPAAPNMRSGGSLPIESGGQSCGMPRCCGGMCQE